MDLDLMNCSGQQCFGTARIRISIREAQQRTCPARAFQCSRCCCPTPIQCTESSGQIQICSRDSAADRKQQNRREPVLCRPLHHGDQTMTPSKQATKARALTECRYRRQQAMRRLRPRLPECRPPGWLAPIHRRYPAGWDRLK